MDDDDESDSALPSRSLIASQHALHEQQQQRLRHQLSSQQRRMGGGDTGETLSPPMTALHALHSQLLGSALMSASTADDNAGKVVLDDEKQRASPTPSRRLSAVSQWMSAPQSSLSPQSAVSAPHLSSSVHASPSLRGASPSSTRTTPPILTTATFSSSTAASSSHAPHWSDRSASFSAIGQPSSVVSTSRSSSFAATNSPFLSHSPFSSSPFSPFTASALPSTPFELPRAALPPNSPALSSASSRSSSSSITPTHPPHSSQYTTQHNGSRPHLGSIDLQLLNEAEEGAYHNERQHRPLQPSMSAQTAQSTAASTSPWLSPSLHIIDDAPPPSSRVTSSPPHPLSLR